MDEGIFMVFIYSYYVNYDDCGTFVAAFENTYIKWPGILIPRFLKFPCFLDRSCSGPYRCHVLFRSCFPPKRVFSELWTCFRLDFWASCILKEMIDAINLVLKTRKGNPSYTHNAIHFRVESRLLPARRTPCIVPRCFWSVRFRKFFACYVTFSPFWQDIN